ncbi:hypothetical protein CPB84DRAFT_1794067 [Gymnopilus junonius]|uniref:Uncharacterized protein n=1 Tax=Gymnopilus junonius TaxID=109634 RepID=A0A9P5THL0_GYMJU|nr:hypothetical protein CPB84DRAFT_1794067 [Gymnopilus junonius]
MTVEAFGTGNMKTLGPNDFPVEMHTHVLQTLVAACRRPYCPAFWPPSRRHTPPPAWVWSEHDLRKESLFPFNAVRVCTLWRDILAQIMDCWDRVVFDLSKDPTPLLDAFEWSRKGPLGAKVEDGQLEVLIYSPSREVESAVEKELERKRVQVISKALQPHVHRCKSITFDVTYASSLPPTSMFFLRDAPHLGTLSLTFRIDDFVDADIMEIHDEGRLYDDIQLATSFPKLSEVTLTGRGFMDLARAARAHDPNSEWFRNANFGNSHCHLFISHFEFTRDGPYSFFNFVSYISQLSRQLFSVHLRDLSLAYEYTADTYILPPHYVLPKVTGNIYFISLSDGFLENFYAITDVSPTSWITFDNCTIPENVQPVSESQLRLRNMVEKETDADEDGVSLSLRRILSVWSGYELSIETSSAFNDALLRWMTQEDSLLNHSPTATDIATGTAGANTAEAVDDLNRMLGRPARAMPAWHMTMVSLHDCGNFSPSVCREMIQARSEIVFREEARAGEAANNANANVNPVNNNVDEPYQDVLSELYVQGEAVPSLSEEDKEWFRAYEEDLWVHWMVRLKFVEPGMLPGVIQFESGRREDF